MCALIEKSQVRDLAYSWYKLYFYLECASPAITRPASNFPVCLRVIRASIGSMSASFSNQAAVLLAVAEVSGGEEILLTLRAQHLASHSGEVAFPGGMWEPQDPDLRTTALREANEEVGLDSQYVEVIAQMQPSYTRAGTCVTPYIARVPGSLTLAPNPEELQDLFWFPLEIVKRDLRVRTDIFKTGAKEHWAPVYQFCGFTIWGFTARVLVDFVAQQYGITLKRSHSAQEVLFTGS